jgi:hypothetical protein
MVSSVSIMTISNSHTDEAVKGFHVGPLSYKKRIMIMSFQDYRMSDEDEDIDDDIEDDDLDDDEGSGQDDYEDEDYDDDDDYPDEDDEEDED